MDNKVKDDNIKILKWLIVIMIFTPITLIIVFYSWFFHEASKVHEYENINNNQMHNIQK